VVIHARKLLIIMVLSHWGSCKCLRNLTHLYAWVWLIVDKAMIGTLLSVTIRMFTLFSYTTSFSYSNLLIPWSILADCTDLQAGYYVCVGFPGTPTSPITTTRLTNTSPQPERTGVESDCKLKKSLVVH